jgi:hypothetical protein
LDDLVEVRPGGENMSLYDLVIRGGTIADGSGNASIAADVTARDRKTAALGVVPVAARRRSTREPRVMPLVDAPCSSPLPGN